MGGDRDESHPGHEQAIKLLDSIVGENTKIGYFLCTFEEEPDGRHTLQASHNAHPLEVADMVREILTNPRYASVARVVLKNAIDDLFLEKTFATAGSA